MGETMSRIHKSGKNYMIEFKIYGVRYHKSLGVSDKRSALKMKAIIDSEIALGKFSPQKFFKNRNEHQTLSDLKKKLFAFLEDRKSLYRYRTIQTYHYNMNELIRIVGDIELSSITPQLVEKDIESHLYANYSRGTVRQLMTSFRFFFNKALDWGLIQTNPFSKRVPPMQKRQPRYLREEEIRKMEEYFKQDFIPSWQYDLVFLTLNTGLRRSEVYNLTWDQVDLINEQIIFPGKGDKDRIVPLNHKALSILHKRRRHIKFKRIFWEITHPYSLNPAWQKFRVRTGIKIRFHDLRSTYASYYVMGGGSLMVLKEILGHEDIQTTMIYATLSREVLHKDKNIVAF